jgi:hypothetical protein
MNMVRFFLAAGLAFTLMAASAAASVKPIQSVPHGTLLTVVSQTVDPCHKQCAPLLKLDSRSEAKRTYGNCRALCAGKGTVTCPDGSKQSVKILRCGAPGAGMARWKRWR